MNTGTRRTSSRRRSGTPKRDTETAREKISPEESYNLVVERKFTPEKDKWDGQYEFCGPWGALGIMLLSHVLIFYFFVCIEKFQGTMIYPGHPLLQGENMLNVFWEYLSVHATPTWETFGVFTGFFLLEYILAALLPGVYVKGLPIPSENDYRYVYRCNAVHAWYCVILFVGALHFTELFPLWKLREEYGRYLSTATIWADAISIWVYISGLRKQIRMSHNVFYDFFMGSGLNFRLPGNVDVKLFAECRNSWVLLMIITLSNAAAMYREIGYVTGNMCFLVFAQLLYVNAIQKGEECIITTWDIFYEKFGWMLAYWNTCGVPFLYSIQALYIQTILKDYSYKPWQLALMVSTLIPAYYIWDNANSQKNRFRMMRHGVPKYIIQRRAFPQLPWGHIENPRTLKSERGELFVDGWYRYGRKLHYTADLVMAFLWGASCGFDSFIPFFYFFFFISHLLDRERRDDHRCRRKYGELWERYLKLVPYKLIPGIY
ncbi:putative sterol C-24 reductase [Trypanosoma cruzi]|uniref:Delta(24(24(1)))-sterol reductase n=4 Tax=Trypanosoma cruzi TaxID=5693 RepID=Q4DR82_TRYCC|nr:sterol C-24 reductase, putative [Trypanosoma cruzi]EAN95037.1 sterol C-24 reductase, putative [Trypanosoma cruzi]PWV11332.1 putative sterol C-24 reductase [Trypanosoma cruzi]|eukprot:XP_816888.1 sterol C-24 reductase [Trypanosoma cruzi strain CL Brener]